MQTLFTLLAVSAGHGGVGERIAQHIPGTAAHDATHMGTGMGTGEDAMLPQ